MILNCLFFFFFSTWNLYFFHCHLWWYDIHHVKCNFKVKGRHTNKMSAGLAILQVHEDCGGYVVQPHRESPLILHELRRACMTGSTSGRLEGLKREAPGWRKSFGVLNQENTHVNEASLEKDRGVLCSALRWKLKARGVLECFPLLIRPYARFLLGLLNPETLRGHLRRQQECKIPWIMRLLLTPGTVISQHRTNENQRWDSCIRY